ncbi:MAG: tetratricopeptide repeat protein [Steroidobacteraceae bacterium]|jgi:predicted O-linked N-acetylglucosamine transferase (SPINDLY family)
MAHSFADSDVRTSPLDEACGTAMRMQLAGRLDRAEQLYRAILQSEPRHAAANYCLGMLQVQLRRPGEGLSFLLVALEEDPRVPDYWLGYLEALLSSGQIDAARGALELARQHGLTGRAAKDFARRLAGACADAEERALLAALARGDSGTALQLASGLVAAFPGRGIAWKVLGALLWTQGHPEQALAAMQTSVRLLPQDAEAHCNLGLTLAKSDRFEEAEACLRKAIDLDPKFAAAHYRLGMTYSLQARLPEAEVCLRRGIALKAGYTDGDDAQNHSNLLFIMSHDPAVDADSLYAEHRRFAASFEDCRCWPQHANHRDPERILKVGFVSGDYRDHPVALFIEPIFASLRSRADLQLHAYSNHSADDPATRRLRTLVPKWRAVEGLSDDEVAHRIMADGIDVLIDLSGHTAFNRLAAFARKPAPVQASWIGYPGTTGLRAMDYYVADRHWLPAARFADVFTEKLAYLPDRWTFQPHPGAPQAGPLPAIAAGRMTFGSFNRMDKINGATVELWSMLLREVPQANLLLGAIRLPAQRERLIAAFAGCGIERRRLMFHPPYEMDAFLALYGQVDLCLDTVPYNGGTMTLHALWMGVPTLTLAGSTPAARAGAGILAQRGLDEFIADSALDFAAAGRHWARHLPELARLRAGMRARLQESPGGQPELIAAHFARALRHMWRRWCGGEPAASFATDGAEGERR